MSSVRFEPPARPEKKKKTLGEATGEARRARISFKNYLRELEEQNEYEEDDLYEEDAILPDDEDGVDEIYQAFFDENDDLVDQARDIINATTDANDEGFLHSLVSSDDDEDEDEDGYEDDPVSKAIDFLMDELETYLQNKGFTLSDIETWIDGPAGDILFDKFYNGLT
jgi:hypothetical protein